ncbi:hypothetical protein [Hyphomicrobium sp. 1Nfss2.1]|uniref:hypothetical protein n=1 Tax=Hyphomicrobium sp. 1Nfss2.1 TaxID=3413936 RepID=UPI003C7BBB75
MRSEREGQQALVASTDMPKEMRPSREAFEKVGFVFGEDVDELFVRAKLPPGWTRAGTSHAMHSDIIDEQGRKRVGVFYKAAFYDRRANAGLITRYQARWLFPSEENSGLQKDQRAWIVTDADREIFRTEPFKNDDYPADDAAKAVAHAWLNERFPDASDPTAYW